MPGEAGELDNQQACRKLGASSEGTLLRVLDAAEALRSPVYGPPL